MTRQFLASVLSLALVATSFTAAPARADEDVAKVLAGLVALGIIAKVIDDKKDDQKVVTRNHGHIHKPKPKVQRHRHPTPVYPWLKKHPVKKIAPERCLRQQWTHRGNRQVYGARCMQRHANAQLPQACLRQANVNNGPRYFYTKRCLRKQGWRA